MVTVIQPFGTSSLLIVVGTPHWTVKASLALAPISPPACHNWVRKLDIIALTVAQVFASLGANVNCSSATLIDCSI